MWKKNHWFRFSNKKLCMGKCQKLPLSWTVFKMRNQFLRTIDWIFSTFQSTPSTTILLRKIFQQNTFGLHFLPRKPDGSNLPNIRKQMIFRNDFQVQISFISFPASENRCLNFEKVAYIRITLRDFRSCLSKIPARILPKMSESTV